MNISLHRERKDFTLQHLIALLRLGCCLLTSVLLGAAAFSAPGSIILTYQKIAGFEVKYVTINLNDPDVVVTTAVAQGFPTGLDPWCSFISRLQPDVAINGSYFCPHSDMPVGDIAANGYLLYSGVVGTALCLTPDNRLSLRLGPHQMKPDWRGLSTVLCAGPRLLTNGEVTVNARAEGFRDPRVLGSAPRSALAWRADGVLILLTIEENISLRNLAYICQHLDAKEAMALDGGSSSGLYADGRTITRPARRLSNILAVYSSRRRFQQYAAELIPPNLPLLARLLPDAPMHTCIATGASYSVPAPPVRPTAAGGPLVSFTQPDGTHPLQGTVPITVTVQQGSAVCWTTLRINGVMHAMSNISPLEYDWDSTKEKNGRYTLEVNAWSNDHHLLAQAVREVEVRNANEMAMR